MRMGLLQRIRSGLVSSSSREAFPAVQQPILSSQGCAGCSSGCAVKDAFEGLFMVQKNTLESLKQNAEQFNRAFDHKDTEQMVIHARLIFGLIHLTREQGTEAQARSLLGKHLTDDSLEALSGLKP